MLIILRKLVGCYRRERRLDRQIEIYFASMDDTFEAKCIYRNLIVLPS